MQTSLAVVKEQNEGLQKFNSNLQKIANDRSIQLSEIKEERNQWLKKFEDLQTSHNQFIKDYFRKYYMLFGFCILLALVLLVQSFNKILTF